MDEPRNLIDAWPAEATLRIVKGDPFAFLVQLRDRDGELVDVSLWEWAGTVAYGLGGRLDFETFPGPEGCRLLLRGDATARLSSLRPGSFDVACRQDTAGEGVTVLRGPVLVQSRVTDPLRHDPAALPSGEDLVPA